jgi:hyperosmotically inducible periplasmic protein
MRKSTVPIVITLLPILAGGYALGQAAPDNTKSNAQDPSNRGAIADAQPNDAADIDLVQKIRRSIIDDKSLSTYGHNIKVVAVNGTVTLNGVVRSDEEKQQIGRKAASIAGDGHVIDQLKVAASK